MNRMRISLLVFATLAATSLYAVAGSGQTALEGYCPVCLVKMDKLVKGNPQFSSVLDGKKYLFPSAKQKQMFDANPAAFIPALGGDCTVCRIEKGATVAGKPEFHIIHDGRLFLFPGQKQQQMFAKNPAKYAEADLALDGNCAVCLVKSGKLILGKPDYASIHDGRRYLFPNDRLKRIFDENPTAFVPALGGDCTVCRIEANKDVPGKPEFHLVHDGRLYLFPSARQQKMFRSNPGKYADADLALGGNCTVCKVEMGKNVKGKPEFAIDWNGKRYLFPGQKQLDMFRANPGKYTIQ